MKRVKISLTHILSALFVLVCTPERKREGILKRSSVFLFLMLILCTLTGCEENTDDNDSGLSGTLTAIITVEKTVFLPTDTVTISAETSAFVENATDAKVYEWGVTNEEGNKAAFTDNGATITLTATEAGKYQASLVIKQANLTSSIVKKTFYRVDSENVTVRIKVQPPEGTEAMYLAHTGGYVIESGNPINTVDVTGDDWAPYATLLTEEDSSGNYLYKDGDFFYRDYIVKAGAYFEIQPTLGSWGSKARKGKASADFLYDFVPCRGTNEKPFVVELFGVNNATTETNQFHWGYVSGDAQALVRPPLLTFCDDGKSYKLVWNTDATSVTWGKKGTDGSAATVKDAVADGKTSGHYAIFEPLEAGETYFYQLAGGDKVEFKAPSSSFTFAACSDHQSDETNISSGVAAIKAKNPAFVVSAGDISNDGYSIGGVGWKTRFFEKFASVIEGLPFCAAPGNHDGMSSLFADYLGQETRYHTFVYGNTRFIMLDVEGVYTSDTKQYKWLEKTLSEDSTSTWKIVVLHENPYCCVPTHYSNLLVRQNLVGLFDTYGVNLVIGGHMHAYDRTRPIKNGVPVEIGGTQYITLPCMGASASSGDVYTTASAQAASGARITDLKSKEVEGYDFQHVSVGGKQGFALFTVTNDTISVEVQTSAGASIDRFSIGKDGSITEK